ncbi:ATP-dependent Clp protease proteolytic subunit [Idiomarina sp. Sol25]|uniref:SDH family Clp fold serine proteinase n=1 Tax=Idiomarina sp. Sol25 TaxID=3064000 RepID=UPI00294AA9C1|nr:ATP-dependent Clp protease proteolytic subunit [Idiomarina sp. Sol25]MDV6328557.1 ATP-dependent Clp protease proteolytic subunit [Idiomarina sp. Sol25]
MAVLNETIEIALTHYSEEMSKAFGTDVFSFVGGIRPEYLQAYRAQMESLAARDDRPDNLVFMIHTPGGVAEVVEKMVEIVRYFYKEVWFVVPDMAMSAGTILCMSGDKIYMDYSSALGPIDPQIANSEGHLVPALGYLDQVERMIERSSNGELTDAEFAILQNQDLATLRRYEQARELSISLLKHWLVKYKFKDWDTHASNGEEVSPDQKEQRAKDIAEALSDHKRWHSHGRMIGVNTLTNDLRLKIEDYTDDATLKNVIRRYSDLLLDCVQTRRLDHMFHHQRYSATN